MRGGLSLHGMHFYPTFVAYRLTTINYKCMKSYTLPCLLFCLFILLGSCEKEVVYPRVSTDKCQSCGVPDAETVEHPDSTLREIEWKAVR